jgi:CelD/BcsL family acetyltransferase involved in cellulose biosynthesis
MKSCSLTYRPHGLDRHVCIVNPLNCPEWDERLKAFDRSNFFHTKTWASIINAAYGHRPVYILFYEGNDIRGMMPIMNVRYWQIFRKGVSLPFSDHSEILVSDPAVKKELWKCALKMGRALKWRSLEVRDSVGRLFDGHASTRFFQHQIDLSIGPDQLLKNLHPSMRRGVRKSLRIGATLEFGKKLSDFDHYFKLHLKTRQRHGLPPQPYRFFRHLAMAAQDTRDLFIATVRYNGQPIAAALLVKFQGNVLYKYGASDASFLHIRPNNLLMWGLLDYCARQGFKKIDLGRTSLKNEGLRRFKCALGAKESMLEYFKFDFMKSKWIQSGDLAHGWYNKFFRHIPMPLLRVSGNLIYRHIS